MKLILGNRQLRKYLLYGALLFSSLYLLVRIQQPACLQSTSNDQYSLAQRLLMGGEETSTKFEYDKNLPLIFIGGMPRSGTTLLRVLLDAHPHIRCGEETRVIPRILGMRQQWMSAPFESRRLREAGITESVLDSAIGSFILEIIAKHGRPAARLCNKDPFTLRSAVYLRRLFPSAKFIFMIRDGRAVVHSIISRKVTISGFDLNDFSQCLRKWNTAMQAMDYQCDQLGPEVCLPVYYEKLVLEPRKTLQSILTFLHVPWNDSVLNHEQLVNKPGGISLSNLERSTDQVIKPINMEALGKWYGKMPKEVEQNIHSLAPMLSQLGYKPDVGPEQYGSPDDIVRVKQLELQRHQREYNERERQLQQLRENIRQDLLKERSKNQNGTAAGSLADSQNSLKSSFSVVNTGGGNSAEPAIYAGYKHSEEISAPVGSESPPRKLDGLKGGKLVSSIGYGVYGREDGENDIVQGLYSDQNKNTRHR